MTLNAVQIGEVLEEIRPAVAGCRVETVFQPVRDTAVLVLASGEVRRKLLFSLEWWGSRVYLVSRHLDRLKTFQPFFAMLQKTLPGAVLREVSQVGGDRIVEMSFASADAPEAAAMRLVFELMGPVSNAYLLDASGRIQHTHRRKFAGRREFKPQDVYAPPAPAPSARHDSVRERFPDAQVEGRDFPLSETLDTAYEALGKARAVEERRHMMIDRLRGTQKKLHAKIEAMEREAKESAQFEREFQIGEMIKANLEKIPPRAKEITVDDLYGEGKVAIPLDESLSPVDNMERQFKHARKMKAAEPIVQRRLEGAKREAAAVAAALEKAEKGELREDEVPNSLRAQPRQQPREKPKEKKQSVPGLEFRSKDGFAILIGRNNAENDKLTMQVARGNDIWMHVQHQTGSHVIVSLPPGKTMSLDTLLDAANLAGYFSKIRSARKIPVDYTYKKYIRKPHKAEPGTVTYSNNKTIIVQPDPERLKRLLEKEA
jgi:predicted ribosome quality control (RQC) complex YloA/Tae2 family protein